MLKTETYLKTANEFGVSVGIAKELTFSQLKDSIDSMSKTIYKRINTEVTINRIITDCIDMNEYRQLQRELFRIRKEKGKRKISELTIYREAMKAVKSLSKSTDRNGSKTDTKSKQIYSYK